jgi:hypothetical protein
MLKSLLLVGALIAGPAFADQPTQQNKQPARTKWYILSARQAKCLLALDRAREVNDLSLASPAALEAETRKEGLYQRTDVIKR